MDKPVLYLITAFFLLGGIDYILGSPLKLGGRFEEGMKTMGSLALGIIGIYSLSPVLLKLLTPATTALSSLLHIDPSILPACIFAVDMGGYPISQSLAQTTEMGRFSGVIIASTLGATVSFSIPVASGFIPKMDQPLFANGIVIGIISLVPGCLAAGLVSGLGLGELLWNMVPLLLIVALLSLGLIRIPDKTLRGFTLFGKLIMMLGIIGILLQGLDLLAGVTLLPEMVPFSETVALVGKITLILAGAYPMMEVLNRLFKKHLEGIGNRLGVNSASVAAMIGNLASNLLVFGIFQQLNSRGKVLCTALAVSAAFMLGGQFAYAASVEPGMTGAFFVSKIVSGIISIFLVLYLPVRKGPESSLTHNQ